MKRELGKMRMGLSGGYEEDRRGEELWFWDFIHHQRGLDAPVLWVVKFSGVQVLRKHIDTVV